MSRLIDLLVVGWHQHGIWANVDLSSNVFCGIYLRAISEEVHWGVIREICSEINYFEIYYHITQGPMS